MGHVVTFVLVAEEKITWRSSGDVKMSCGFKTIWRMSNDDVLSHMVSFLLGTESKTIWQTTDDVKGHVVPCFVSPALMLRVTRFLLNGRQFSGSAMIL